MHIFEALSVLTKPLDKPAEKTRPSHIQHPELLAPSLPKKTTNQSTPQEQKPAYQAKKYSNPTYPKKENAAPAWREDSAKVLWVTDGDTFTCMAKGEKITVRIAGMDAPELAARAGKKQRYGDEAKQALETLIKGKVVFLELLDTDKYGRTIAHAYIDEAKKQSVGLKMIEAGLAYHAPYETKDGTSVLSLSQTLSQKSAQVRAMIMDKGVWDDPHRISPTKFRNK